jgi:hypothetical protein
MPAYDPNFLLYQSSYKSIPLKQNHKVPAEIQPKKTTKPQNKIKKKQTPLGLLKQPS